MFCRVCAFLLVFGYVSTHHNKETFQNSFDLPTIAYTVHDLQNTEQYRDTAHTRYAERRSNSGLTFFIILLRSVGLGIHIIECRV